VDDCLFLALGLAKSGKLGQMLINTESGLDPGVDPYRLFTRSDPRVS
jgi:hypothetical protein